MNSQTSEIKADAVADIIMLI